MYNIIMPTEVTPELRALKSFMYQTVRDIKNRKTWDANNQPWTAPVESHLRLNTEARRLGSRVAQNGEIRSLSISDIGDALMCTRLLVAAYAGVAINPLPGRGNVVYRGKSGTLFHDAIEKMLPSDIVTAYSETQQVATGPRQRDRTWVHLPSIGVRTTRPYTRKATDGIGGKIDGYIEPHQSGFELKSRPDFRGLEGCYG